MSYQGYKNYETWAVSLWLSNDERLYAQSQGMAEEAKESNEELEDAQSELASQLKDFVEEMQPLQDDSSLWSDLLGHAMSSVDWLEIAENLLED